MKKTAFKSRASADPTRAKILKAARNLFVKFGFNGVSIGLIAKKAKINHSLIFHHFGNKEGLWRAVKQNIVEKANDTSPTLPALNQSFSDFLVKLIKLNIYFYRNNPEIIHMISWQRLESGNEIGITQSTETKAWLDAIKHYQNIGSIYKHLRMEFILTYLLSLISSAAMDPNIFIQKNDDLDSYIQFLVEVTLKALSPVA